MKFVFAVFISTISLAATQPPATKDAPQATKEASQATKQAAKPAAKKPAPPAAAKPIKAIEIPPGAVQSEPGRFSYTDPQGKKWNYAKTPFGIARWEDKPADPDAPKPIDPLANVKITEEGDVVKFARPGPFGTYTWQKKRAELDEGEKAALAKAHDSSTRHESKQESKPDSKQD
jgi:hypothetical protein